MRLTRTPQSAVFAAALAFLTLSASGHVPTYTTIELQARANLCANPNEGTFNLPCDYFFTNGTPWINSQGMAVIKLSLMGSTNSQGILLAQEGTTSIVYTSPADASLSDPSINADGYAVFPQTFSSLNGIYFFDHLSMMSGLETNQPLGANSWGSTIVNDLGHIGFRATFSNGQAYYSYDGSRTPTLHAAEATLDGESPYSFLFSPAFNNNRQIAAHVRLGAAGQTGNSQPDQIRLINPNGSTVLIAQDTDSSAASPYAAFDSSRPAVNDLGQVAFIANLAGGGRGVFFSNGIGTLAIATTNTPGVTAIDFFPPAANNHGHVAFRGRDENGLLAVFVGDGDEIGKVVTEHDLIPTDLGPGRIDQHDGSPVFGGSITVNEHGDVAFQCALAPPDNNQIEWGSGLFIAYADPQHVPGDVTGDGVVNVSDLLAVIAAWGAPTGPADLNEDGFVNVSDLLIVITNWSTV